jgi:hypothetical protein
MSEVDEMQSDAGVGNQIADGESGTGVIVQYR